MPKLLLYNHLRQLTKQCPATKTDFNITRAVRRMHLSDQLLGLCEVYPNAQTVWSWLAFEQTIYQHVSYVELKGSTLNLQTQSQTLRQFEVELIDAVTLQLAYMVRWGFFWDEIPGQELIVVEPNGSEHSSNLQYCDCDDYQRDQQCSHLVFARYVAKNRRRLGFLKASN